MTYTEAAKLSEQFAYHTKPKGELLCPTCGCDNVRAGVKHRALPFPDNFEWGCTYVKSIKVSFGNDFSIERILPKMKKAGRTKEKLADLLEEILHISIDPEDLIGVQGYRRNSKQDLKRWSATAYVGKWPDGTYKYQHLSSWNTMTDCIKYGITIDKSDQHDYEVWANKGHGCIK